VYPGAQFLAMADQENSLTITALSDMTITALSDMTITALSDMSVNAPHRPPHLVHRVYVDHAKDWRAPPFSLLRLYDDVFAIFGFVFPLPAFAVPLALTAAHRFL
jgi:hypothetical protein